MLYKSFTSLILLVLTSSTNAQATIAPSNPPFLHLKETPTSGEVQRPSIADPCTNVNIAQDLDTSTSVTVDETGAFLLSSVNVNPGADGPGSRLVETIQVDASGTGKGFVAAQMAPANDDTQQFIIKLPAGTKCTGGTNQNLCLASITTVSGPGICVVVSQAVDPVDTVRSPLNTSQAHVRSGAGRRKHAKRSVPVDEEESEPAPAANGDQTSPRKRNKRKEKWNKEVTRHNRKITGKRLWSSRLTRLVKLT